MNGTGCSPRLLTTHQLTRIKINLIPEYVNNRVKGKTRSHSLSRWFFDSCWPPDLPYFYFIASRSVVWQEIDGLQHVLVISWAWRSTLFGQWLQRYALLILFKDVLHRVLLWFHFSFRYKTRPQYLYSRSSLSAIPLDFCKIPPEFDGSCWWQLWCSCLCLRSMREKRFSKCSFLCLFECGPIGLPKIFIPIHRSYPPGYL